MKFIPFSILVFIFSCQNNRQETFAEESSYAYYSPLQNDTIHCIQYGSSTINEFGVIDYQYVQEELVDSNAANVKIKGKLISMNSDQKTISFTISGDTLDGTLPFNILPNPLYINREIILAGKINLHPKFKFKIDALLIIGIKKALVNH